MNTRRIRELSAEGSPRSLSRHARSMPCGFTLVELLVVIAMLALLLAILLPSLRRARWQAKRVVCQTHLQQIAVGWHLYLEANDDRFLKGINANWNYGGQQGEIPAFGGDFEHPKPRPLNPYLNLPLVTRQGANVFRCPEDRGGGDVPTTHFAYKGTSYATNLMLIGQTRLAERAYDPCVDMIKKANKRLRNLTRSQIHNEPKLILIGDGGWLNAWDFNITQRIEWHHEPCSHNIAFMDGHAEFIRIRKGLHVTPSYHVIPFRSLVCAAQACQEEKACE